MKKFILVQRGFSLMEVMVAIGVLSIGAYFLVSTLKNSLSLQKGITATDDARTVTSDITNVLSDPVACLKTFGGGDPIAGFSRPQVFNKAGTAIYSTDQIYGNRTIKMKLLTTGGTGTDARTNFPKWTSTSATEGFALVLTGWQKTPEVPGPAEIERFFKIHARLDPTTHLIIWCSAQFNNLDEIWRRNAGDSSKIYYDGGNVGIGVVDPEAKLHIEGEDENAAIGIINTDSTTDRWPGFYVANYTGNTNGFSALGLMTAHGKKGNSQRSQQNDRLGMLYGAGSGLTGSGQPWPPSEHAASILFLAAENFSTVSKPGIITLSTAASNTTMATERMRINHKGNVGIGTQDPVHKLTVQDGSIFIKDSVNNNSLVLGTTHDSLASYITARNNDYTTPKPLVLQADAGNVGIGIASPTEKLHVAGKVRIDDQAILNGNVDIGGQLNVTGSINASAISVGGASVCTGNCLYAPSDARLKDNIRPIENILSKVLEIRPIFFEWRNKSKYGAGEQLGFIAQELEKVFPQLVKTDPQTGLKSVAYFQLIAPIVESISTLYSMLLDQKNSLMALVSRLSEQDKKIGLLESELALEKDKNLRLDSELKLIKKHLCEQPIHPKFCSN